MSDPLLTHLVGAEDLPVPETPLAIALAVAPLAALAAGPAAAVHLRPRLDYRPEAAPER